MKISSCNLMRLLFWVVLFLMSADMQAQQSKYLDTNAPLEERVADALSRMTLQEKIKLVHAQSKFTSAGVPRLGIRQLNMDDGPHGVREELDWNEWKTANWTNDSIVALPSLTCLAATWNPALASLYGHSVSEEFAFRGKDVMLGPGVNIQRTPLNGRAFEYMGEDPYLASEMVVPYIQERKTPLLPLTPEKLAGLRVLIVGENATRSLTLGGGSSELKTLQEVSPFEALQQTIEEANKSLPSFERGSGVGLQGYTSGRALYDKVDEVDPAEQQRLHDEAIEQARQAHLIIYIGGMNKNRRQDCENGDREDYNLSFGQNQLIADLAALPAPMVVVTFGGNPYAMPWLNQVEALVHCWYLGSESGTALANVLTGKVNPSGKLPVTFARQYEDYPYVKYGQEAYPGINKQVHYREGVFVGYRGFEKNKKRALFPFGYGLSYTTFRYGKPQVSSTAEGWQVEVDVTNTGSRDGKEVVHTTVRSPLLVTATNTGRRLPMPGSPCLAT